MPPFCPHLSPVEAPISPNSSLAADESARVATRTRRTLSLAARLLPFLVALLSSPSAAVLLDTGDGTGNTTAPAADPGFANVGVVNFLSGVYLRDGWVLTANHVGEHPILLDGVTYQPIIGSGIQIQNPNLSFADLFTFKLTELPPLPDLSIADSAATVNTLVTIIGNGRNRGVATSWSGIDGWGWDPGREIRWGTNRINLVNQFALNTSSFWVTFDDLTGGGGQHESDLVDGDSGGGVFKGSGVTAKLIGISFARAGFMNQPAMTSLYGNAGLIVDLFAYRAEILAIIDQPDCGNGLDDDGDGVADYPNDPGCTSLLDPSEHEPTVVCDNEIDDDNDGFIDLLDAGCSGPGDPDERGAAAQCDNGFDDDDDLLFDFPEDPSCLHSTNLYEAPEPGIGILLAVGLNGLTVAARHRNNAQNVKRPLVVD